ncbi:MAG: Putative peptidoglycan binding domain-containing protein [uncultured Thiotrichaceae bacterium]|uniref:Peptidoglycan binding domain-containing protein n=1 Tax=uncultured Thiotrichaceae bacterium TaxID=298394 RepID=A0A6S6T5A9_9GAMM|nr:MAG: Putative peptidoglycan binding domain-containing protein [uncultured Thiotrichaceae bacterium]
MTTLTRKAFLQEMSGKKIALSQAQQDPRLHDIDLTRLDLSDDKFIRDDMEMHQLFKTIDDFDVNGSYRSVDMGTPAQPTTAGIMIQAIRDLAMDDVADDHMVLDLPALGDFQIQDTAFRRAFPKGFRGIFKRGSRGRQVVAIQYALGRLGYLKDSCDGHYGKLSTAAVRAFQDDYALEVTGIVDEHILKLLDQGVSVLDLRPPVIRSGEDPMRFMSDFRRMDMPTLSVERHQENTTWDSPSVQIAYGEFVANYWEVMKENKIEADCKALALFFMDQFRKQLAEDSFVELPLPRSRRGSFQEREWSVSTRHKTRGLFSTLVELARRLFITEVRRNYRAVKNIQALDPDHSMVYGVNMKYPRTSAHQVAMAATEVAAWHPSMNNRGDKRKPEIPLDVLEPGHMIFMDHTGNGSYDHTVNVIKVERDEGKVKQLILAVGSYDDVRDSLAATVVNSLGQVNQYSEEVTVDFDAEGHITDSRVTWSSEPSYVVHPRYAARNTLMELKAGGQLFIGRWG